MATKKKTRKKATKKKAVRKKAAKKRVAKKKTTKKKTGKSHCVPGCATGNIYSFWINLVPKTINKYVLDKRR